MCSLTDDFFYSVHFMHGTFYMCMFILFFHFTLLQVGIFHALLVAQLSLIQIPCAAQVSDFPVVDADSFHDA